MIRYIGLAAALFFSAAPAACGVGHCAVASDSDDSEVSVDDESCLLALRARAAIPCSVETDPPVGTAPALAPVGYPNWKPAMAEQSTWAVPHVNLVKTKVKGLPAPNTNPRTPRMVVENACKTAITVWRDSGNDMSKAHEVIQAGGFRAYDYATMQHETTVNRANFFFQWIDAIGFDRSNFGLQFEMSVNFAGLQYNYDGQRGFNIPMGVAFIGVDGEPIESCPSANLNRCVKEGGCRSNKPEQGGSGYDSCAFDGKNKAPPNSWRVKVDKDSDNWYVISPDENLAVINYGMRDFSAEECNKQPPGTRLTQGQQDPADSKICGPRRDINLYGSFPQADPACNQGDACPRKPLWVEDSNGELLELPPTVLINPDSGEAKAWEAAHPSFGPLPRGSAKYYQTAVNQMCGNQAPTQWANVTMSGDHTMTGFTYWDSDSDGQARLYDPSKMFLDHGIIYEGDFFRWNIPDPQGKDALIFKAGNANLGCTEKTKVVEVRFKACPFGQP